MAAEQSKSYRSSNPLSDRAVELWKTLRNWIDAASNGTLDANRTSFILFAPNANPGGLAEALSSANDQDSIRAALGKIAAFAQEKGSAEWLDHAKAVVAADAATAGAVIKNFSVDSPVGSPSKTLPPLLKAKLISPDVVDDALKWAHGWIKTTVDALLEAGTPAQVSYEDFHNALLEFVKTHDRLVVLRSYAGTPDAADVDNHLAFRCYVRQLRIIDLAHIDVLEAVNDYLRSSIDRTEWARRGFVTEHSLDDFERELIITWRNKKRKVTLAHPTVSPQQQGQMLYSDCMDHTLELDGLPTPAAFLRGSMHSIADDCTIGWHPDYARLLATTPTTETAS